MERGGIIVIMTLSSADLRAADPTDARAGAAGGLAAAAGVSAEYKVVIVEEYDRLTEPGAKGPLLLAHHQVALGARC